jgi:hypothetical protein
VSRLSPRKGDRLIHMSRIPTQRAFLVFPALALVVAVGVVSRSSSSDAAVEARKTTTTLKRRTTATTQPPKGNIAPKAISVLAAIPQERERPQGYNRNLFRHWSDDDGDSCNTREEVLIAESRTPAQVDPYGCKVIAGDWFSDYDGVMHTDPSDLDIDHFIPLKEAWDSGAWAWSASQRQRFANDLSDGRSLIAVTARQNRSKGDKDLSNWLPPRQEALCSYVSTWVAVKAQWKLSMDQSEWGRARNILTRNCPNAAVARWGSRAPVTTDAPVGSVAPDTSALPGSSVAPATTSVAPPGDPTVRQVKPHSRCKRVEVGQLGVSEGITYVCVNRKKDGTPAAEGYFYWQVAP